MKEKNSIGESAPQIYAGDIFPDQNVKETPVPKGEGWLEQKKGRVMPVLEVVDYRNSLTT